MEPHEAPRAMGTSTVVASHAAVGMVACVAIERSCRGHHAQVQEVPVASPRPVVMRLGSF